MAVVDTKEANYKEVRLRTCPGAVVTLSCTNIFALEPSDRRFVLDLLETLERYEAGPEITAGKEERWTNTTPR